MGESRKSSKSDDVYSVQRALLDTRFVHPEVAAIRRYAGIAPTYDPDAALYEPAAGVP